MRWKWISLLMLLALTQVGCVHRRVTINSYPSGALVKVDGHDIGYTPASFDFTWYGTREVQLLRDGYETHTEMVDINAPWYQKFPLDFVSDNFLGRHRRWTNGQRPKNSYGNKQRCSLHRPGPTRALVRARTSSTHCSITTTLSPYGE